jgi:hypothetical protein
MDKPALTTGNWPKGLRLINNGFIMGRGGDGGSYAAGRYPQQSWSIGRLLVKAYMMVGMAVMLSLLILLIVLLLTIKEQLLVVVEVVLVVVLVILVVEAEVPVEAKVV